MWSKLISFFFFFLSFLRFFFFFFFFGEKILEDFSRLSLRDEPEQRQSVDRNTVNKLLIRDIFILWKLGLQYLESLH